MYGMPWLFPQTFEETLQMGGESFPVAKKMVISRTRKNSLTK